MKANPRPTPAGPTVAVFAMTEVGHFQRLRPLVAGLARTGCALHVFTDRRFAGAVAEDGGGFEDLFADHPLDDADGESQPIPCRYVSFAGHYGAAVAERAAALAPDLVVYDTFAVVGRVVGRELGVPAVNVCAGHNMQPATTVAALRQDPRVSISARCERAVELLRDRFGIAGASPFSYVDGLSRDLNVYCEPPEFLTPDERRAFEPVAFHGSLQDPDGMEPVETPAPEYFPAGATSRIYASFGTVVWRYWRKRALSGLEAVSRAVRERPGTAALISLGGTGLSAPERSRLEGPGVRVEDYVDQGAALARADAMITHQGLNSTHEAIWNWVPMLSRPFFSDQPALAARCRELGLAVPLVGDDAGEPDAAAVTDALDRVEAQRAGMAERLRVAREWEAETIAARPEVWRRISSLGGRPASR